jgi:hypothetical protein
MFYQKNFLFTAIIVAICLLGIKAHAQEATASNSAAVLIDAPGVQPAHAAITYNQLLSAGNGAIPQKESRWERRTYNLSKYSLPMGAIADMTTTYLNMSHGRYYRYEISCVDLEGIYFNCAGAGPTTISAKIAEDKCFAEGGPARIFGEHNTPVVMVSGSLTYGLLWLVNHEMAEKGPRGKKISTALSFVETSIAATAATSNMKSISHCEGLDIRRGGYGVVWFKNQPW